MRIVFEMPCEVPRNVFRHTEASVTTAAVSWLNRDGRNIGMSSLGKPKIKQIAGLLRSRNNSSFLSDKACRSLPVPMRGSHSSRTQWANFPCKLDRFVLHVHSFAVCSFAVHSFAVCSVVSRLRNPFILLRMSTSVLNNDATNDSAGANLRQLLTEAKGGSVESLGRLLETYQNYLKLRARTQLDEKIRGRVSPSDVVQETMLEAHCGFAKFRGNSDGEFFVWLRKILVNNLAQAVERHVLAAKRDVRREVARVRINASLDRSAMRLEAMLADHRPSAESDISLQEELVRMANAMTELSADYRDVIVMRHLEGVPFATIAERMGRTSGATRMIWLRAIEQMRQILRREEQS